MNKASPGLLARLRTSLLPIALAGSAFFIGRFSLLDDHSLTTGGMLRPLTAFLLPFATGLAGTAAAGHLPRWFPSLPHPERAAWLFLSTGFLIAPLSVNPTAFTAAEVALLVLIAWCGFTSGTMTAGFLRTGFIEDNQIPDPATQEEVRSRHLAYCGKVTSMPVTKRLFDLAVSGTGLILSAPVAFAAVFLLWFEDPGPALFVKNSVGRLGRNFRQYKLRTMVRDAERTTGPVLSAKDDRRVLKIGRFLRKTALDELPQLWNIFRGDMSVVGPRPQRTVLVREYLRVLPEYAERHCVAPGLAGLAQVAGHYFLTPRQKLRFDRLYARRATLAFDLLLLWLAFAVVFWWRWRPSWNGRIPRRWLHPR